LHDAIPTYGVAIDNGNTLLVQTTRRFILNAYFPLQFALMAIFFLYIGVKVIASKRPLLLPSKVFFLFMVFAFTPQIIMSFEIYFSTDGIGAYFGESDRSFRFYPITFSSSFSSLQFYLK